MNSHLRRLEVRLAHGVSAMSPCRALPVGLILGCLAACAGPTDQMVSPIGQDTGAAPAQASLSRAPGLSPVARQVSQIAARFGDQNYLMLDKTDGRIIVFEHGTPSFTGAALTGENPVDVIPADAFVKPFSETRGLKYKVTPAGRFTVSSGFDPAYGDTLDVNEIQGKDWDIAIHRVWLGAPAEHRDVRLRTPTGQDKHITYGCIDVEGGTMSQILRRLPNRERTPLYILPEDTSLVTKLFQPPREAARKTTDPSG
jgi:hypothetical protein